jgi:hypothetical protein
MLSIKLSFLKYLKRTLMKKKEQKKDNSMFPIYYNGKLWEEEDCDDVFLAFYHNRYCLNCDCAVYLMSTSSR